ncbi:MAG: NAD(P)-dependent oxidoreductase [Nocardioides sp.]
MASPGPVLLTGACGLVGRATLARLLAVDRTVVATDVRTPATERVAAGWGEPPGLRVGWCDLTDPVEVRELVTRARPSAVIHLAAIIPPLCYAQPVPARRVNVDATAHLVAAVSDAAGTARFVQASSVAVHGARNPYRIDDLLAPETPLTPSDLYGSLKAEAEILVRESDLDWVVLRLGGVMTVEPSSGLDLDVVHFESLLPVDGRIQTVDVRDVAHAFVAATTADAIGEVLMVGGDGSHRLRQGEITPAMSAAVGLVGGIPAGRRGDPDDDTTWFATDWMDTTRAQELLGFQHHSWPSMLAEVRAGSGLKRHLLRVLAPVLRQVFLRTNATRGTALPFAPTAASTTGASDA